MSTALILAGGMSSRMGVNKAELMIRGKTLLDIQIAKVREAGFKKILVSGYPVSGKNMHSVHDIYPHKGSLSGIHAGLLASGDDHWLVLCVDVPLIPADVLKDMMNEHQGGITVLSHNGMIEPTIGVYDSSLSEMCESILQSKNTSVRALLKEAGCREYIYQQDESLLLNCNTPDDYLQVCALYEKLHR